MSRRKTHWTLIAIGVIVLLASIIAALITRANSEAVLVLPQRPSAPVIVTEPGVLDAVASEVTIRGEIRGERQVLLAVGRSEEVDAWVGDAPHERVTGLSSWEELTVDVVTPDPEATDQPADEDGADDAAPDDADDPAQDDAADEAESADEAGPDGAEGLPDPAGSDLWVAEAAGAGSAELTWQDRPGRWSLVAATDGVAPAPEIELVWDRERSTPWLWPGVLVGLLLGLVGAGLLVVDRLAERERVRRDEARARAELGWSPGADTGPVPLINPETGERYTRRELRAMEEAREDDATLDPTDALGPGTPASPSPDSFAPDILTATTPTSAAAPPWGAAQADESDAVLDASSPVEAESGDGAPAAVITADSARSPDSPDEDARADDARGGEGVQADAAEADDDGRADEHGSDGEQAEEPTDVPDAATAQAAMSAPAVRPGLWARLWGRRNRPADDARQTDPAAATDATLEPSTEESASPSGSRSDETAELSAHGSQDEPAWLTSDDATARFPTTGAAEPTSASAGGEVSDDDAGGAESAREEPATDTGDGPSQAPAPSWRNVWGFGQAKPSGSGEPGPPSAADDSPNDDHPSTTDTSHTETTETGTNSDEDRGTEEDER
ncbi:MAG TPA: hypothetical protein VK024_09075 [Actinomycetaceae bacterium]|nr:hypothetical protein [Actinomycetaceae bacterium]